MQPSWPPSSPSLVISMSSFLLVQGGCLSHRSLMTSFREEGQGEAVRVDFPFLLYPQTPSVYVFSMPRCRIWGQCVPEPQHKQLCTMNMPGRLSSILVTYPFKRFEAFWVLSFVLGQKKIPWNSLWHRNTPFPGRIPIACFIMIFSHPQKRKYIT